jgi:hypothetical protein
VRLSPYFTLKDQLILAVTERITSSDRMAQAYALKYFSCDLASLQPIPSPTLRKTVIEALNSGDELFYRHLWWVPSEKTSAGWRDAFLPPYKEFVRREESQVIIEELPVITDDDVPF